jgi:hypothetical protein
MYAVGQLARSKPDTLRGMSPHSLMIMLLLLLVL